MKKRSITSQALAISAASLLIAATTSQAQIVFGITSTNALIRFDVATPGTVTTIGSPLAFAPDGIDFNPQDGTLYAVDIGPTLSQLYTLSITTGVATPVGTGFPSAGTATNPYDLSTGTTFGFDFNPKTVQGDTSIRIRLVSDTGSNVRLNNLTGTVATGDLSTGTENLASTTVNAAGAAYTNNVAQTPAAGGTTVLKIIDTQGDRVLDQNPPNDGTLVNPLGLTINATGEVGFDIFTAANGSTNTAYLTTEANAGVAGTELYTVNFTTGAASLVGTGQIGASGTIVRDIAVQPVPEPTVGVALLTGLLTLGLRRRRQD